MILSTEICISQSFGPVGSNIDQPPHMGNITDCFPGQLIEVFNFL